MKAFALKVLAFLSGLLAIVGVTKAWGEARAERDEAREDADEALELAKLRGAPPVEADEREAAARAELERRRRMRET